MAERTAKEKRTNLIYLIVTVALQAVVTAKKISKTMTRISDP